jgi:hypothetical protein
MAGILLFLTRFLPCNSFQTNMCAAERSAGVLVIAISIIWKAPVPLLVGEPFLGNGRGACHSSVDMKEAPKPVGADFRAVAFPCPSLEVELDNLTCHKVSPRQREFLVILLGERLHVRAGPVSRTSSWKTIRTRIWTWNEFVRSSQKFEVPALPVHRRKRCGCCLLTAIISFEASSLSLSHPCTITNSNGDLNTLGRHTFNTLF